MQGIDSCVLQIDNTNINELIPKVIHLIRKGVGLPTKAGTARLVCMLSTQHSFLIQPYADTLLKALSGAVQ